MYAQKAANVLESKKPLKLQAHGTQKGLQTWNSHKNGLSRWLLAPLLSPKTDGTIHQSSMTSRPSVSALPKWGAIWKLYCYNYVILQSMAKVLMICRSTRVPFFILAYSPGRFCVLCASSSVLKKCYGIGSKSLTVPLCGLKTYQLTIFSLSSVLKWFTIRLIGYLRLFMRAFPLSARCNDGLYGKLKHWISWAVRNLALWSAKLIVVEFFYGV